MARYTFTCEHFNYNDFGDENNIASKHTTEFRADTLETMLENFEMFLRGSGFHFDGVIDVVSLEDDVEDDVSVMSHIADDLIRQNSKKSEEDIFGDVFVSNESEIDFDFGAAGPTLTVLPGLEPLATEDDFQINLDFENENCSLCKLPISVMDLHQCFDPSCPSGAYRNRNQYAD
jgi:hypothetical protein